MHQKAKEWDLIHNAHTVNSRYVCGWIPHNRPCDMCGEPVPEGFIHHACLRKELEDGYERPHLRRLEVPRQACDQGGGEHEKKRTG